MKQSEAKKPVDIIVDRILEQLDKGIVPWKKTWSNAPQNISGREYRGVNRLLLGMLTGLLNYESPYFLTYNQAREMGGFIRKGEHGFPVVFWKMNKYAEKDEETQEITEKAIPFMRYYTVFNLDQCENIDCKKLTTTRDAQQIQSAEDIITGYKDKPAILIKGSQPCYIPIIDTIEIPAQENFHTDNAYYSTLYHEIIHSTGHKDRLNRKEVTERSFFGSCDYSLEELVAEIGACFLSSQANIELDFDNSAAYVKNWLSVLGNDKKLVITAAARAEKAMNYILGRVNS